MIDFMGVLFVRLTMEPVFIISVDIPHGVVGHIYLKSGGGISLGCVP